jgi:hypothetical protein
LISFKNLILGIRVLSENLQRSLRERDNIRSECAREISRIGIAVLSLQRSKGITVGKISRNHVSRCQFGGKDNGNTRVFSNADNMSNKVPVDEELHISAPNPAIVAFRIEIGKLARDPKVVDVKDIGAIYLVVRCASDNDQPSGSLLFDLDGKAVPTQ